MHRDTFVYSCMWEKHIKGDRELQNFMCHLYLSWHLKCSVYGTLTCRSPCSLLRSRGSSLLICSYIQVLCRSTQSKPKRGSFGKKILSSDFSGQQIRSIPFVIISGLKSQQLLRKRCANSSSRKSLFLSN